MRLRVLSVSEINKYIKRILVMDPILNNIHLKGEISNFKQYSSGHAYFSLKDSKSKINCVMFKEQFEKLKFKINDGLDVIVKGYISCFERDGQYQMYINELQPEGIGELYLAFQQLKIKLEQEGIFDTSFKKQLPRFPRKIAVVTSPSGAVIRDIISVTHRRNPMVNIYVYPVTVQGETASKQIATAIEKINEWDRDVDIIIVARGGGSMEELWAFNEEIVARSIFNSCIPIISAVGHETDYTICDFAADLRAPTPSAAAEMAVPCIVDIRDSLNLVRRRFETSLLTFLQKNRDRLEKNSDQKMTSLINDTIQEKQQLLDIYHKDSILNMNRVLSTSKNKLSYISAKFETLNPFSTILRGYAIVQDAKKQQIICSIEKVKEGDDIDIMLTDGELHCVIKQKTKEEKLLERFSTK